MWGGEKVMKKEDKQIKAYMGEDTVFNGSLTFEGTVRIDGKFEGQVHTDDTLIVGETGHLMAEISAGTVICMGRVEGTIMASKKVEIHANSRVVGNVKSPALYIELGGILDGSCDMTGKESKIIPLVKTEEKEKKAATPSTKG
ncbi:MAG: polymer-forming cytoskeletal protein [Nitrospinaceae bacterium]|jgi:cytoskeletal protein CcmA (bactofilin family)|nr:polymer-forming cytoskeletal protein [Nitrospina sp.]MBT5375744.1 polymer-forming cytoskeletal protein [Nitrospinaceae bacterium]MBT5867972.1 polymer-forming cytoskeletal protein [Nitrospinaceae bacterium]MBT6345388.1 polymer-forming cytoskeletal protein [Nitrospina sp.]